MGERMPFDGQELEESLSAPDVEGERAAIDAEFASQEEYMPGVVANHGSSFNTPPKTPDIFDEEGNLHDGTKPEEDSEEDSEEDPEEEHLKRIMTSHNTAFRDAWSILKNDLFTLPRCKGCGQVVGSVNEEGYCTYADGCQPK